MEIVHDPENFGIYVDTLQSDWKKCRRNFSDVVSGWRRLCKDHFDGVISLGVLDENSSLTGEVLGKKFFVELSAVVKQSKCYGQAVVVVHFNDGTIAEATRFLVNRDANVVDDEGKSILDPDSGKGLASMLTSIAKVVLELPRPPRPISFQAKKPHV
ncbi:hypothetical protein [Pseudomonas putida]|uniref:hypothetical protein n=1 Tax=Pseudomonas putida TaxID=303 RepID=UPI0021F86334|nr:hypothetical protein [Pseudomonas putida]